MMTLVLCVFAVQAQPGNMLRKAAQKAVQAATDKAAEAAAKAVDQELNKNGDATQPATTETSQNAAATYGDIMRQVPELPTAQQFVEYKDAELNGKGLKLLSSKVTTFSAKLIALAADAASLATQNLDSAKVTDMAYRQAELYTGLSKEEIEKLSTMSEEEQNAYLAAHYQQGRAEATLVKEASEVAKYIEPLQPVIDRWTAQEDKISKLYAKADEQCSVIYMKYAAKLSATDDKERNDIMLKYYTEVIPIRRAAVQEVMRIRLNDELPIADQIEKDMAKIRAQHPDAAPLLLNYQHMTAAQYFADPARLLEIPEFGE